MALAVYIDALIDTIGPTPLGLITEDPPLKWQYTGC